MHKIYAILKGIYLFKFFNLICSFGDYYNSGDGSGDGETYETGDGNEYNHYFFYGPDYNKGDGFKEYYGDNDGNGYNYNDELEF